LNEQADNVRFALIQLHAPLAAFGGAAVDSLGATRHFPARSMLTGLLANALGWRRQDFDNLSRLQSRIVFASRLDSPSNGRQCHDFQTAQLQKKDSHWTTYGEPVGRAGGAGTYLGPHLRYRSYLDDLQAYVAFTLLDSDAQPDLESLVVALNKPARPLFIGRKSCLPSKPLFLRFQTSTSAVAALTTIPIAKGQSVSYQWSDLDDDTSFTAENEVMLCDERDWRNGQHVGLRKVFQCTVTAERNNEG